MDECHLCRQIGTRVKEGAGVDGNIEPGWEMNISKQFSVGTKRFFFSLGHFLSSSFVIHVYFQWHSVHLHLIHSHLIHQQTALSEKLIPMCC